MISHNGLELAGPLTSSAVSSVVINGTLQEESGGNNRQLQRQAEPHPLATNFPNRSQYTPPYTPGRSQPDSTTFPLGEVAPIESDVEILSPQAQASKASTHNTGTRLPQSTAPPVQMDTPPTKGPTDAHPVENAIESQPKDWGTGQMRTEAPPSVHGTRSRTRSPVHSLTRDPSPVIETSSRRDYPHHSQHREVEYTTYRHIGNQSYHSPDRHPISMDSDHRAASGRGRSPSPKSLVDDHEEGSDHLDHDVSITMTNYVRSQSSSSISGIESRRESLSRSQSHDVVSSHVHHRRGYTPPRMNTQPQPQWTRSASPVRTADASYHEANDTPHVTRAEGRGSLASRLDLGAKKKAPTPAIPHSEVEIPTTRSPATYRFGKMRSEDYGADGRQTRRRLQDRIDGNQTGAFGPKFGIRCPYSHRVNGANDVHDKNQPHPGYNSDEWREIMEYVQRFGYAPPQLTKEGCVYHPSFKPPEGSKSLENFKPPESSQPRSHPLNPFNMPPAAQGPDRYMPSPTPPVPQQAPMAIPYPQPAPMPVPMPAPQFSSGPPPHSYSLRPAHIGANHPNPFDTGGTFAARPALKKRRTGPKGQFRPVSGDYGSQQAPSYQWPPHPIPPPNWSQQPPNNHPPAPVGRPNHHLRQAHRPNTFHNQQGPPPLPPPFRRKRTNDHLG